MKIRPVSVAVIVSDRKRAKKWYVDRLGLKVIADEKEHWTVVGRKGSGMHLHLCESEGGKAPNRTEAETGILLLVDRPIPKVHQALVAKGVAFERPPEETPWGWVAKLRDPDGNLLTLMRDE